MRHKHAALVAYAWMRSLALSTVRALFSWTDFSTVCTSCTVRVQWVELRFAVVTVVFHCASFSLSLLVLCVTYLRVLKLSLQHD